MNDRLLTVRELADRLCVSTGALLRWTRDGKVPSAVKLPSGAIRYIPEKTDEWLVELRMANGGAEEVSSAPDAVRRMGVSSIASSVPLRTEEEPDAR